MKLAENILSMCEKLAKKDVDNFVSFLSKQVDFDLTPHIDLKNSKRDYITIDTGAIPDMIERRLKSLVGSYGGKIFRISDNGGLGHAFHLLDKEKIRNVEEAVSPDIKELRKIVKGLLDDGMPYNKNQEFRDFKDKALEIASKKGLRVSGIDVMQALDKALK